MGFIEWAAQSGASLMGSGALGRGAAFSALKADRANRNINRDVWSKVAAQIDIDARQGRYFGCYAIPRTALATNNGGFNQGLGNALNKRNYFAMYDKRPDVGSKLFADVAIFWGHKSMKLRSTPSYQSYAFEMLALYFAECIGHGCCDMIGNASAIKDMQNIAGLKDHAEANELLDWFIESIVPMVAKVAFRDDIPCIMKFHVSSETDIAKLTKGISLICDKLLPISEFNDRAVRNKLSALKVEFNTGNGGMTMTQALTMVRDFNNGRREIDE